MEIGSKGLAEVNLTIPQGTSLTFTVTHKDEEGHVVDHSGSTANMAVQAGNELIDLSECCSCSEDGVAVSIPATAEFPLGKWVWDMIVTTDQGERLRLAYGKVTVVDTYALDGE